MQGTTGLVCAMMVTACATQRAPDSGSSSRVLEIEACSARASDAFYLGELVIEGTELVVDVRSGGGCKPHSFSVCWDGAVLESYPPQVNLSLSHDAHGDSCDAFLTHSIRIDLDRVRTSLTTPVLLHITGAAAQLDGTTNTVTLSP